MHRIALIATIALAILLTGCQARRSATAGGVEPTRTPSPTAIQRSPVAQLPAATPTKLVLPASVTPSPSPTPSPTSTATPTASPTVTSTQAPRAAIVEDLVNLRAGPDTAHPAVEIVSQGDEFGALARTESDPPWVQVCCAAGGQSGWVRSDLLNLNVPLETLALAEVLPTPPPAPTAAPAPARSAAAPAAPAAPVASQLAPPPPPGADQPPSVNPYTGLSGGNLSRRPVFVCINNDTAARPQYGLGQADLVYEYIMEGRAITRFTALFWSQEVARIGPVRSARLINVQMTPLYQAALLCSGASSGVRYMLKYQVHFPYLDVDLDDPGNNVFSQSLGTDYRTRLQTSSALLEKYVNAWGVNRLPNTAGLQFGEYGGGSAAQRVDIPYPALSRTSWVWNGEQWARLGSDGAPALDAGLGRQITEDNVVIQWAQHERTDIVEDSLGSTSIRILLVGSGPAMILRDGKTIDATWHASDPNQPPTFTDSSGAAVPLRPGRTWFQIVEPSYRMTIQ